MDNDELWATLKARGFILGDAVVREDGMLLLLVNNVYMFRLDAVDLANDHATVADILARNKGKVFPNSPYK